MEGELSIPINQKRINKIFALQRRNDIIGMILSGVPSREIRTHLMGKYKITSGSANIFIHKAHQEIKKRRDLEIQALISLHLHRCENIYAKLKELGATAYCMDVLRHKEKLLQFHREGFHMKVNKGEIQTVSLTVVDNEYDLNKLEVKEQEEISQLLHRAKRDGSDRVKEIG